MLDITKKIVTALGLDPVSESLWSGGDVARQYAAFNDAGVECEVGEFLYAMARVLKPKNVLETGTHQGIGAMYLAQALQDNGFGLLDTLEFISEHYHEADRRFTKAGFKPWIRNVEADVTKWNPEPDARYKLVLLDTEPQLRFAELVRFYDYVLPGGFIFIHDLNGHMGQVDNSEHGFAWPWGRLPNVIKDYVRRDMLRPFHFATPRGLTGFYKVDEQVDYKWGQA